MEGQRRKEGEESGVRPSASYKKRRTEDKEDEGERLRPASSSYSYSYSPTMANSDSNGTNITNVLRCSTVALD